MLHTAWQQRCGSGLSSLSWGSESGSLFLAKSCVRSWLSSCRRSWLWSLGCSCLERSHISSSSWPSAPGKGHRAPRPRSPALLEIAPSQQRDRPDPQCGSGPLGMWGDEQDREGSHHPCPCQGTELDTGWAQPWRCWEGKSPFGGGGPERQQPIYFGSWVRAALSQAGIRLPACLRSPGRRHTVLPAWGQQELSFTMQKATRYAIQRTAARIRLPPMRMGRRSLCSPSVRGKPCGGEQEWVSLSKVLEGGQAVQFLAEAPWHV